MTELKACPWCKKEPIVLPEDPEREGDGWAQVRCITGDCPAKPVVNDGLDCALGSSDDMKEAAILRWNTRASPWISVEDRLPDEGQEVILRMGIEGYPITYSWASIEKGKWVEMYDYQTISLAMADQADWMPIPE
ncbi:MAG: DUF551 domain-containing protein [Syntrophobacteria bacterium]